MSKIFNTDDDDHDDDDKGDHKAIAIPRVFSENSRDKNARLETEKDHQANDTYLSQSSLPYFTMF